MEKYELDSEIEKKKKKLLSIKPSASPAKRDVDPYEGGLEEGKIIKMYKSSAPAKPKMEVMMDRSKMSESELKLDTAKAGLSNQLKLTKSNPSEENKKKLKQKRDEYERLLILRKK